MSAKLLCKSCAHSILVQLNLLSSFALPSPLRQERDSPPMKGKVESSHTKPPHVSVVGFNSGAYGTTYVRIFHTRQQRLRSLWLEKKAALAWPEARFSHRFSELDPAACRASGGEVVVFGIVLRESGLRQKFTKTYEQILEPEIQKPCARRLVSESDVVFLEESSTRLRLARPGPAGDGEASAGGDAAPRGGDAASSAAGDLQPVMSQASPSQTNDVGGPGGCGPSCSISSYFIRRDLPDGTRVSVIKDLNALIPGAVVACCGNYNAADQFVPREMIYPFDVWPGASGAPEHPGPLSCPILAPAPGSNFASSSAGLVLAISCLRLQADAPSAEATSRLLHFVSGFNRAAGAPDRQIREVIICGNLFCAPESTAKGVETLRNFRLSPTATFLSQTVDVDLVDSFLAALCGVQGIRTVVFLPGSADPASKLWPQEPVSDILFQRVRMVTEQGRLLLAPNPARLELDANLGPGQELFSGRRKVSMLCSDGLNLGYLAACAPEQSPSQPTAFGGRQVPDRLDIEVSELLLRTGHYFPVAPMFADLAPLHSDPFVLSDVPDILLFGGCRRYACEVATVARPSREDGADARSDAKLGRREPRPQSDPERQMETRSVLIACVPDFGETHSAVLLDPAGRAAPVSL